MMFVARPLAILISTIPFRYSLKEKTFMMWGGIKGAVPIVLATYPVEAGLDSNGFIFDTIFFAVFLSCLIQGMTLAPLSKLFEFTEKRKVDSPHTVELHSLKSSEIDMFEVTVYEISANVGKKISELNFDKDVLISSIVRNGQIIFPKGDTKLKENDILFVLTHISKIKEIKKNINTQKPVPSQGE